MIKGVLKELQFTSSEEVTAKVTGALTVIKEMAYRNASKSFMNVGKNLSLPRELLKRKCCENRCKVTYFV
jgi:hypothetical protein